MTVLGSPGRTLGTIVVYMLAVVTVGTIAYMVAGWNFTDAFYMVLLTVYSVGYNEVHPVDTSYLHAVTVGVIIFGCTGAILLTGALVQFLTITQIQQLFGAKRMIKEIEKLSGHVIIVGLGRIGAILVRELKNAGTPFVILERNEKRAEEAREAGYLCIVGDATNETSLQEAGVTRARALATVLPDDAANVFITLSARALNRQLEIIARGEAPSTEGKLRQAGADRVILPAHIGAERIAEMILYPDTARMLRSSRQMQELERTLRGLGLDMQVVVMPEKGALTGLSIDEIEKRAMGQFFVVQVTRADGEMLATPEGDVKVHAGDGVVIVGRGGQASRELFDAAPEAVRAGRQTF